MFPVCLSLEQVQGSYESCRDSTQASTELLPLRICLMAHSPAAKDSSLCVVKMKKHMYFAQYIFTEESRNLFDYLAFTGSTEFFPFFLHIPTQTLFW